MCVVCALSLNSIEQQKQKQKPKPKQKQKTEPKKKGCERNNKKIHNKIWNEFREATQTSTSDDVIKTSTKTYSFTFSFHCLRRFCDSYLAHHTAKEK